MEAFIDISFIVFLFNYIISFIYSLIVFDCYKYKINFIVIAYGTDLENVDLARKIVEKKHESKIDDLIIFVKCRKLKKEDIYLTL
mgnify:CR=1 FL=1